MDEIEYLDKIERQLADVWEFALNARDGAQGAMEAITTIKVNITKHRIELAKAQIAADSK